MKTIIEIPLAPQPIGPYSLAVKAGNFLFLSGQIALDPTSGHLMAEDIIKETTCILNNIKQVLFKADYSFADIVKTSIFLTDMSYFAAVNEVYRSYFETDFPARETIAVQGLPKGARVEISVIAYKA